MFNTRHNHKEEELLEEILEAERRIEHDLRPHRFTLFVKQLKEHTMSLGNIPAGQTGTFAAALLLNGAPYVPTTPFALALAVTWQASDPSVTLAPSDDTTSVVATIPGSDTITSVTITASATTPDGTSVSNGVTVTVTPEQQVFTLQVTQTA